MCWRLDVVGRFERCVLRIVTGRDVLSSAVVIVVRRCRGSQNGRRDQVVRDEVAVEDALVREAT
jgi:hypothetical protein